MDENLITKVPENLKRLVCITARAFYQPLQIVCLDILTKYPCVPLTDLVEVLKMHGSLKQLQQALNILLKDKLVKCLQKMEVQETDKEKDGVAPKPKMVHYYYISYQQFVNVVKYKLDQMRKKLESEDKMSQSRISYKCSRCDHTFSDLDVGKLFDLSSGDLRCSFCGNSLAEEQQQKSAVDSRTLISQLNEYVRPITDLLRETESLNLAPELLEPDPQSISNYLLSSGIGRRTSTSVREPSWNARSATNIYGDSTAVSVNIGNSSQQASKVEAKERPAWMVKSTVHSEDQVFPEMELEAAAMEPSKKLKESSDKSREILQNLMAHEVKPAPSSSAEHVPDPQYSSSSSEDEDMGVEPVGGASSVSWMGTGGGGGFDDVEEFEAESSDDDDEGFTVKVGDRLVPLGDITDEMVAQMTKEEKDRYTDVFQKAYADDDDFN